MDRLNGEKLNYLVNRCKHNIQYPYLHTPTSLEDWKDILKSMQELQTLRQKLKDGLMVELPIRVELGKGDRCFTALELEDEIWSGLVIWNPHKQKPIGHVDKNPPGTTLDDIDSLVLIEFTKEESIDALIKTLQEAKQIFQEKREAAQQALNTKDGEDE